MDNGLADVWTKLNAKSCPATTLVTPMPTKKFELTCNVAQALLSPTSFPYILTERPKLKSRTAKYIAVRTSRACLLQSRERKEVVDFMPQFIDKKSILAAVPGFTVVGLTVLPQPSLLAVAVLRFDTHQVMLSMPPQSCPPLCVLLVSVE